MTDRLDMAVARMSAPRPTAGFVLSRHLSCDGKVMAIIDSHAAESTAHCAVSQTSADFSEVAPSIYIADYVSPAAAAAAMAEFTAQDPWDQAQIAMLQKSGDGRSDIVGVIDYDRRKATRIRLRDIDLSHKPLTAQLVQTVRAQVCGFVTSEFGMHFDTIGGAEIIRYPEGGEFKPHTDTHRGNAERAFTVIVYLNEDFAGGETEFPRLDYRCQPKAGRVLVFLPTELHAGRPVLSGEKTVLVFWVLFPGSKAQH